MLLHFYKYQATGNDFVMVDDREERFPIHQVETIERLCDRRFGIGADGLICIRKHTEADFEMLYFNADGKIGSMCGNGARSAVHFARFLGIISQKTQFMAYDGLHEASFENEIISLKMSDVDNIERIGNDAYLNTGSPHYVAQVQDLEHFEVVAKGKAIRYNDRFREKGTNVNFVEVSNENQIKVRTYERGVEDETLSCGTGVTACALVHSTQYKVEHVKVQVLGGNLEVSFLKEGEGFRNIYLKGPAACVFKGQIEL